MNAPLAPAQPRTLPARGGVSLKPEHYRTILDGRPDVGFFEIHAENYMGAGGSPHRYLEAIREIYPLSLHGVGLSIGGAGRLDKEHLKRLKGLITRYRPQSFSEHLAWSTHETGFFNDLLPLPYNGATLKLVAAHIDQVQESLGCQMLLENPSTYLAFAASTRSETDFLREIVRRTGCGLLLDVNNVHVAATNQNYDPRSYLQAFPLEAVGEIHLAGHTVETDDQGRPLLIDTHDSPVIDAVWALYAEVIVRSGALPTLIERDANIPSFDILHAEAIEAEAIMASVGQAPGGLLHASAA